MNNFRELFSDGLKSAAYYAIGAAIGVVFFALIVVMIRIVYWL